MAVISDVAGHPMKWKADSLAWRLKVSDICRPAGTQKSTTIGAIDFNATKRRNKRRKASQRRSRLWRKTGKEVICERTISTGIYAAFVLIVPSLQARHFTQHNTASLLTESGRPWKNQDMTAEQERVVTELRQLRYGRQPSLTSVARAAGISRMTLYEVINSGCQPSEAVTQAIKRGLRSRQNRPVLKPTFTTGL